MSAYVFKCCEYTLEAPQRGASNKYSQHMFSRRNKKNINIFWSKNLPCMELWTN